MTNYNSMEKEELNVEAELLLDLLHGAVQEEGYTVKTYGDAGVLSTSYGGLVVEKDGETFHINVNRYKRN